MRELYYDALTGWREVTSQIDEGSLEEEYKRLGIRLNAQTGDSATYLNVYSTTHARLPVRTADGEGLEVEYLLEVAEVNSVQLVWAKDLVSLYKAMSDLAPAVSLIVEGYEGTG
jgi:hypothetical protein